MLWQYKVVFNHFTVDETLDDILAGSDEEEESEQLVSQVLDEIGLDTTSKVN